MTGRRIAYHFAVLRVVPHVWTGAYVDVGVIVHARTAEFLEVRALTDAAALRERVPDVDLELLARYLATCRGIARGEAAAGPVALLPPSERFHWLTAPRSDVLQTSPVHMGLTDDPARCVEELFAMYVRGERPGRGGAGG